jgi:hypothetical protein
VENRIEGNGSATNLFHRRQNPCFCILVAVDAGREVYFEFVSIGAVGFHQGKSAILWHSWDLIKQRHRWPNEDVAAEIVEKQNEQGSGLNLLTIVESSS